MTFVHGILTAKTTAFNLNGNDGITQVVALAKLTAEGTDGSITFTGGIPTVYTAPT